MPCWNPAILYNSNGNNICALVGSMYDWTEGTISEVTIQIYLVSTIVRTGANVNIIFIMY